MILRLFVRLQGSQLVLTSNEKSIVIIVRPLVLSAVWISLLKPSLRKENIEIIYAALLVSLTVTVSARRVVYFHVSNYYSLTLFNATVSLNDLTISKLGSLGVLCTPAFIKQV